MRSPSPEAKRQKTDDATETADSMSVEETNAMRAKLGLAPLVITTGEAREDGTILAEDGTAFRHVAAESLTSKKKQAKLRQKIDERRNKRVIEKRLNKVKGLGESDSDGDDTNKWVERSRKMEKKKARQKERELRQRDREEADEARRVIAEEKRQALYKSNALKGMTVRHDLEQFAEGRDVILTLADSRILDEESGENPVDTLVNVNMIDKERASKYKDDVKKSKSKSDYNPLDKFDEEDPFADPSTKLLKKYDEVIDDGHGQKSFQIGADGKIDTTMVDMRRQMRADLAANAISLKSELKIGKDYYTEEEVKGFKKRKRKVKKQRTTGIKLMDDMLERRDFEQPIGQKDHGSRAFRRGDNVEKGGDDVETKDEAKTDTVIEDKIKNDVVVNSSLERTRRLLKSRINVESGQAVKKSDPAAALRERLKQMKQLKEAAAAVKDETVTEFKSEAIVLNDVDEFCRAVGQANAEKQHQLEKTKADADLEEKMEQKIKAEQDLDIDVEEEYRKLKAARAKQQGWNELKEEVKEEPKGVEREPLAAGGLAGALKVAAQKGYIDKDTKRTVQVDQKHKERISAASYSIEDKNRVDHLDKYAADKYRRDRREKTSNLVEFCEKTNYKPLVTIEYVDEIGRPKTEKEAFRDLSHRFHGKGSGKMKQEKRAKRLQEESALQMMSSTDTPLNTVEMLRRKQQQTKSPYINLTGGSMLSAGSKISK